MVVGWGGVLADVYALVGSTDRPTDPSINQPTDRPIKTKTN